MQSAQFNLRTLLVMMATCSLAFALFANVRSPSLVFAASMVPTFWFGLAATVLGGALERGGDRWLMSSVLIGVFGTLVCVMSVFTGFFYTALAVAQVFTH